MKTNSLTKVVKVMNFHALLNVDNAKAKADELMNVSSELTKLIQRIIYNKNLILDKNVLKADPNKPKLSIYIASDLGFCGNFNNVINEQIRKETDCYKIIIGKQIKYRDDLTILTIEKKDFYEDFLKLEKIISDAILNLSYSEINVYYNHYYNTTTFDFVRAQVFPIEFNGTYYEGEDFVIETDVHKMLSNMLSFYICYELKMYEKNCFAAENIKRSIITKLSLDKLKEYDEKQKAEILRKRKELTILKTVENFKKTIYSEESR